MLTPERPYARTYARTDGRTGRKHNAAAVLLWRHNNTVAHSMQSTV